MKCDVTFVNFPVPETVRAIVATKIEERVRKYSDKLVSARAHFSTDGHLHIVRLSVSGGDIHMVVSASSANLSKTVDQAIDRLDNSLRKMSAKRNSNKHESPSEILLEQPKEKRKNRKKDNSNYVENAFDRYESEFRREFDDYFDMVS